MKLRLILQDGALPKKFIDVVFDDTVTDDHWDRLASWGRFKFAQRLCVWWEHGWRVIGGEVRLNSSTWSLLVKSVDVEAVPSFVTLRTSAMLARRPTWCAFDRDLLAARERGEMKPPRRSSRTRIPTEKNVWYIAETTARKLHHLQVLV